MPTGFAWLCTTQQGVACRSSSGAALSLGTDALVAVAAGTLLPGTYTFRLTLSAPGLDSSSASVTINVAAVPVPQVRAGALSAVCRDMA